MKNFWSTVATFFMINHSDFPELLEQLEGQDAEQFHDRITRAKLDPILPEFEIGWSPKRGSLELVVKVINAAKSQIRMATYDFTSKEVADALIAAHTRGVDVQIVSDKKGNDTPHSAVNYVAQAGIPIRLNGHYAIHHHKWIIMDQVTVETGSFNYTDSAYLHNAENVLVLWNAPDIGKIYLTEWQRLFNEADPVIIK